MAIKSSNQITFTEQKKIIEIKEWYLATAKNADVTKDEDGWTLEVQTINESKRYLWNYEEIVYSIGSSETSDPVIIGFYGKGSDGKGISEIKNYYYITQIPELPKNPGWSQTVLMLTPTDKYLWNYEEFIYTDGTSKPTDPAIIGVYGDSGTGVDFQIYSIDGFEFDTELTSIELKTVVFKAGDIIGSGVTYQWSWWNRNSSSYQNIEGATKSTFTVNSSDEYAFSNLRCQIKYDGIYYEDYVSLTKKTAIYTSVAKFFDGSNIFTADDLFLIAYIEVYKEGEKSESILDFANQYYSGIATVSSSGVISSSIPGGFSGGEKMFFVCEKDGAYEVILGEYSSGNWKKKTYETTYTYKNTYSTLESNIIAISKEKINKSQNIDFTVYKDGAPIANTSISVIDSNDPIISSTPPANAVVGQLWLDTSVIPNVLKIYEGNESWKVCSEKIGGNVFTSKPSSYSEGDLWILGEKDVCKSFGPGSMLKSTTTSKTYSDSHWIDADADSTEIKNNIKQNFHFDSSTGLRIGQQDKKFYVNISSTEMGFYDNSNKQNEKVVSISNSAATIKNAKLNGNTEFYGQMNICDPNSNPDDNVSDALFVWKVEQNGSFSLAVAT